MIVVCQFLVLDNLILSTVVLVCCLEINKKIVSMMHLTLNFSKLTCLLRGFVDIIPAAIIITIYITIMIISINIDWTLRWRIAEAIVSVIILVWWLIRFKRQIVIIICTITRAAAGIIVVMILPWTVRPNVDTRWWSAVIAAYCRRFRCLSNWIISTKHFEYHFGIARRTAAANPPMKIISRWCCCEEINCY